MNPTEKRRQMVQIIVLVVLLGGLGASMVYMIRTVTSQGKPKPAPTQQAAVTPTELAPAVPGDGGATPPPPGAGPGQPISHITENGIAPNGEDTAGAGEIAINPNLFRVYSLDPPKNPFVQQERWYEEDLTEYPGYPQLRDEGFFETMDPVVPDIEGLLADGDEWYEASLERKEEDKRWVIEGHSEDDRIDTTLTLDGPPTDSFIVSWNRGSGIPFDELRNPAWVDEYLLAGGLPDDSDLFQAPGGVGLPVPTGTGGMLLDGMPPGDMLACHGVSFQGESMSALVSFNGVPRMVSPGDSLPPRYQVEAITADGVVLIELKSGETKWVPLGSPVAFAGGAKPAQLPTPSSRTAST